MNTTVSEQTAHRVLQRVVLPTDRDLDVLALYVDHSAGVSVKREDVDFDDNAEILGAVDTLASARRPADILGRFRLRVPADARVSFGTYFNAFAASYWRMWTVLDRVVLQVRVSGDGSVVVYRSTADGRSQRVSSATTDDDPTGEFTFGLPLKPFGDGGWYWFDVAAGRRGCVLEEASWAAEVPIERAESGRLTVGCTTFNRTEDCVKLLNQFADDDDVKAILDEFIVVDQGTDKIRDEVDFPRAQKGLGDQLRIIDQANIGGSGGFARGQYETLRAGRSDYALMLDDDIVAEPESILRAVTFADLARTPTIVGGHMFSMFARSQLHSFGERVEPYRFWWGAVPGVQTEYDLGARNLRSSRWLHRRVDVDFNGWWMCLIPRQVLAEIGLGLPLFIKWDDAEFGIRAAAHGFPTVSMPGVAVWHVPWTDKNDALDWQAYFHQRNRTVAALLHSPYERGGRLVRESFNHQVKHLLAMQYSVAELRLIALEDVLAGPDRLHADILTKFSAVRAVRTGYDDARTKPHPNAFPFPRRAKPPRRGREPGDPKGQLGTVLTAVRGVARQLSPIRSLAKKAPEARVSARDARWYRLAALDGAVVSTTDGTAASWYQRDPAAFKRLLARSVRVHERFLLEWPALAERYRDALPELVSPEAWAATFEAAKPPETRNQSEGTEPRP